MNETAKKAVSCFLLGVLIGAVAVTGAGYYFVYRPSIDRASIYRTESDSLKAAIDRERDYNQRERSILDSNDSSISKLRALLILIKERSESD